MLRVTVCDVHRRPLRRSGGRADEFLFETKGEFE
jgi:hypothetical protein